MVVQNVVFGILAASMLYGAFKVVTTQNVVHAALYLVLVLGGAAALFILLAAEFTAITQVIVYIGAIVVLFLFGVMLTRAPIGRSTDLDNDQRGLAVVVAAFLGGTLLWVLADAFGRQELTLVRTQPSAEVGDSIFLQYVIPFEVISVLLLAALVGAVVVARRD